MNPTATLEQRMEATDGYLHACCGPNPVPGFIDIMTPDAYDDMYNHRIIKVPGTATPVILRVSSTQLRMPGRFWEPNEPVTTSGLDAVGYVRSSEPGDRLMSALEESIHAHGFLSACPAVACPIIDQDDPKIAELIADNNLDELRAYCDSQEYLAHASTKFVILDGGARWKICFPTIDMYIKVMSVATSIFERIQVAHQHNMAYPGATDDSSETNDYGGGEGVATAGGSEGGPTETKSQSQEAKGDGKADE